MTRNFHSLAIAEIHPEISGAATSVTFDVPPDLVDTFNWQAGQHLTLRFLIDGVEQRRSYTISNQPGASLRVTIKRVVDGAMSNHVGDALTVGTQVDVMPPFGSFTLVPNTLARRTHYFFGAGSGITPLFAMINAILHDEPHSVAHLIYGNTSADGILFKDDLDTLITAYPGRFTLRHVLSSPSIWSWFTPWHKGRLDADVIASAISETPPIAQDVQYWICGPGSMNADVKLALMATDVPANRIHMESFGGTIEQDTSIEGVAATVQVTLDGMSHDVSVAAGQTVLKAMRQVNLSPPFSCQSGVCGACKATLTRGKVHMRNHVALGDGELAKGAILVCQSVAMDSQVAVKFEDRS